MPTKDLHEPPTLGLEPTASMKDLDPLEEPDYSGRILEGRYHLLHRLGKGGMGVVYAADHLKLATRVAIKVLKREFASPHSKYRKRFLREARAAARIRDPHVVQIMDFGETEDDLAYFVMEFIDGRDLGELLKEIGPLPWSRTRNIVLQVASALRAAHSHGIIHRDVKPSNCVLFDDPRRGLTDRVKVLDFGIAKVDFEGGVPTESLTATDELFGTVAYMAPELAEGAPAGPASDVYAVGIMLFRMLTGRLPFRGPTPVKILTLHMTESPPSLRSLDPGIPPQVESLVLRCLEKRPDQRYSSMEELLADLERTGVPSGPSVIGDQDTLPLGSGTTVRDDVGPHAAAIDGLDGSAATRAEVRVSRPKTERAPQHGESATVRVDRPANDDLLSATAVAVAKSTSQDERQTKDEDANRTEIAMDIGARGISSRSRLVSVLAIVPLGLISLWLFTREPSSPSPDQGVAPRLVDAEAAHVREDSTSPAAPSAPPVKTDVSSARDPIPTTPIGATSGGQAHDSTGRVTEGSTDEGRTLPSDLPPDPPKTSTRARRRSIGDIIRKQVQSSCPVDAEKGRKIRLRGPVGTDGYYITVKVDGVDGSLASCIKDVVKSHRFARKRGEVLELSIQL